MSDKKTSRNIQHMSRLLLFVGSAVVGAIAQQAITIAVLPAESIALALVFVGIVLISMMVQQSVQRSDEDMGKLTASVEELGKNVGIKISYFDAEGYRRAALFSEARKVVEKARSNIVVLSSFLVDITDDRINANDFESDRRDKRKANQERDKYYDALIKKAIDGIAYTRLVQLKEEQTIADLAQDEGYRRHFHRVLDELDENHELKLSLIKIRAKHLSTFVLVDDEDLIWQIDEIQSSGNMQMQGIFIIHDPRREITQHFKDFVESALRQPLGAVRREEVPALEHPLGALPPSIAADAPNSSR